MHFVFLAYTPRYNQRSDPNSTTSSCSTQPGWQSSISQRNRCMDRTNAALFPPRYSFTLQQIVVQRALKLKELPWYLQVLSRLMQTSSIQNILYVVWSATAFHTFISAELTACRFPSVPPKFCTGRENKWTNCSLFLPLHYILLVIFFPSWRILLCILDCTKVKEIFITLLCIFSSFPVICRSLFPHSREEIRNRHSIPDSFGLLSFSSLIFIAHYLLSRRALRSELVFPSQHPSRC